MLRFLKDTWLPTAVFAGLSLLVATADRPMIHYVSPIMALTVVPFVWKRFVLRGGRPRTLRAALAGAFSAYMIWIGGSFITAVPKLAQRRDSGGGWEGLGVLFILLIEVVGGALGAAIGVMLALVQSRLWPGQPEEPTVADATWDGALGGALVATLIAPAASMFAGLLLSLAPDIEVRPAGLMYMTWLVLVLASVWLGPKAVRRWRRVMGSTAATGPGPAN